MNVADFDWLRDRTGCVVGFEIEMCRVEMPDGRTITFDILASRGQTIYVQSHRWIALNLGITYGQTSQR